MSDDDANGGSDREDPDDADRARGPYPIEGTALVKTAALASVPAARVPALLARVQADLGPRIDAYRRRYERIAVEPDRETFLVEPDHWDAVADRVGLSERERDAVVRAHEAAVERIGSGSGRREEFDTALEIRSGVVIGVDAEGGARDGTEGDARDTEAAGGGEGDTDG
ncbi:hypothetical protein EXE46_05840 [Halorubrum sp. GN11_10-6_MGM]|uniref:hypothetical protein n=1 Tax=Halorubrum sp. GN11_10-6_MGM TaxID=2518112 RepID=UPI0010F5D9EF|nr:hypothetical protein [Halorubrum sp. GN11_10-6_MGM]TKX75138.1 hypothetical protein EXE46_05840 [Halorubrum sp. GN11_10-6_MGM]